MTKFILLSILLFSFTGYGGTMEQKQKIETIFNDLRADNLSILDNFYATDVEFVDPIGTHNGLDAVKKYYGGLYKNVTEIRFENIDIVSEGHKHVYVWKMVMKAKSLNKGKEVTLDGTSVIKFNSDDLVIYHRDYFDMHEFIYKHIPFVGWLTNKVNKRLK